MRQRFEALDSCRGLCACAVAFMHMTYSLHWSLSGVEAVEQAYLCVDFFFVLSGFVIASNYGEQLMRREGVMRYVLRRFGRLYPLHAATLLLFVLARGVTVWSAAARGEPMAYFDDDKYSLSTLVSNVFLAHGLGVDDRVSWNFPSWSISAEFHTYLAFALIWGVLQRRAFLAMIALVVACPLLIHAYWPLNMSTTVELGFLRCLYGFACGVFAHSIYRKVEVPGRARLARTGILGMRTGTALELLLAAATPLYMWQAGVGPLSLLAPIMFAFVLVTFAFEAGAASELLRSRPLLRLGELSYSIYMVHALVIWAAVQGALALERRFGLTLTVDPFANAETRMLGTTPLIGNLLGLSLLAATVALSALTYRFVEVPGRTWGRRLAGDLSDRESELLELPPREQAPAPSGRR